MISARVGSVEVILTVYGDETQLEMRGEGFIIGRGFLTKDTAQELDGYISAYTYRKGAKSHIVRALKQLSQKVA